MPRNKATPPTPAPAPAPGKAAPPARLRMSGARKEKAPPALTHERLAADMDAFRKAGGKIEVLGVTRMLTRLDGDAPAAPAPAPAAPRRSGR